MHLIIIYLCLITWDPWTYCWIVRFLYPCMPLLLLMYYPDILVVLLLMVYPKIVQCLFQRTSIQARLQWTTFSILVTTFCFASWTCTGSESHSILSWSWYRYVASSQHDMPKTHPCMHAMNDQCETLPRWWSAPRTKPMQMCLVNRCERH